MMRVREIAVIDSCASDLDTIIGESRREAPEAEAIVLAAARSAASQIAAVAFEERQDILSKPDFGLGGLDPAQSPIRRETRDFFRPAFERPKRGFDQVEAPGAEPPESS
jgi:hypothetical protein